MRLKTIAELWAALMSGLGYARQSGPSGRVQISGRVTRGEFATTRAGELIALSSLWMHESALRLGIYRQRRYRDQRCHSAEGERPGVRGAGNKST